jgi:uncharacterized protein YndB with AHSA1/START domain
MSNIYVKSEQVIDAPPEKIYAALKDYRQLRPQILTPNFLDYRVKQGGVGKGTVIDYRLKATGRERPYHMQVDETVRGKVLTERDTNSSLITRWTLLPVKGGKKTQVSLSSEWEGSSGIGGFFERTFAPMGLRRIYGSMLSMLARSMQPEEKKSVAEEEEPGNIASDLGKFILLVGLVFGIAIAMGFLQKAQLQRSA